LMDFGAGPGPLRGPGRGPTARLENRIRVGPVLSELSNHRWGARAFPRWTHRSFGARPRGDSLHYLAALHCRGHRKENRWGGVQEVPGLMVGTARRPRSGGQKVPATKPRTGYGGFANPHRAGEGGAQGLDARWPPIIETARAGGTGGHGGPHGCSGGASCPEGGRKFVAGETKKLQKLAGRF